LIGRDARRLVRALELHRRGDAFEQRLDLRIALLREGLLHQRQHRIVRAAGEALGRGEARVAIRGHELQRGKRPFELAPQPVVDDHVLARRGKRRDGLSRHRVRGLVAHDDQHLLAAVCTSPSASAVRSACAPASPEATSAATAATFSSLSPNASRDTTDASSAAAAFPQASASANTIQRNIERNSKRQRRLRAAAVFSYGAASITTSSRRS